MDRKNSSSGLRSLLLLCLFIPLPFGSSLRLRMSGDNNMIGVNYGRLGTNIPSPAAAVKLLSSLSVTHVKIFDMDASVIRAFANTGIFLSLCVPNGNISSLASDQSSADHIIRQFVLPFYPKTRISSISVGNECWPSGSLLRSLCFRSQSQSPFFALCCHFLRRRAPLHGESLPIPDLHGDSLHPPRFCSVLGEHRERLQLHRPQHRAHVHESVRSSRRFLELCCVSLGFYNLRLVVTETGWPSQGGEGDGAASMRNAAAFNQKLGTPLRPGYPVVTYIFALFDEDLKEGAPTERHWGLFFANGTKKYQISFLPKPPSVSDVTH
ncbi:unnamed protein product [Spirodela intermedia]|uniref:Uncharacterized protein n=1 Tax=Spirodela intermedia TaxID=51605 RepID=A0A7I8ITH2_SPIIN|nr:unnamed protein product [Spirodela intermedia]CAA6661106.1 unnamed protein product [Spirodela intermedia]